MKKISIMIAVVAAFVAFNLASKPVMAAKSTCTTIQSGELLNSDGDIITTGYDEWGYNYQAKMFNGTFCGAYRDAAWCTALPYEDISLMMKWNDAWLSNQDCDGDTKLDRHYGYPTYIGSGAWLTNHASGTYLSSTDYYWDITGNWMLDFAGGSDNREFRNLVQDTEGNVTGEFWWLNGAVWEYGGTLVGTIVGDTLELHYDRFPILYTGDFTGTIGNNEITGGTFTDSHGNNLTWTATGTSTQVFATCTVTDFVKIVAAPADAYLDDTVTGYYNEGMWYTDNTKTTEIGPAIWGEFIVIQEISSDPCGEYGPIEYMSPLKKGLGNWASDPEL